MCQAGEKKMIAAFVKQLLSATLSVLLVITTTPWEAGAQQSGPAGYSGQGAPLSADELQQLVAPIALYPDALVAQVLAAATFPDQVAYASNWLLQNQNLTGKTLMQAVDHQDWDPSVKALTQFPSVLSNMEKNLSWTSALGEAYSTQAADVMTAIQVLRAKAQAAGNLKSGSQIVVVQQAPQTIVIQSANPQVVYVPAYNPALVYGTPYVTPGYSAATVATTAVVAFGVGIAVGAMMSGGCCGWGYSSWNCGWHSTTVVYRGGAYYGNAAWRGGSYNSQYNRSYNPSTGTYTRSASASNAYGSQKVGQAYNPRTGAYGTTHQGSNASGSWGSSTVSKNGNTAYSQHQTTSQGTTGSVQTSSGGKAVGASGQYNSAAAGKTASGNKYAAVNGNTYSNTGSGWKGSSSNTQKYGGSNSNNAAAKGWGGQQKSSGASAFSSGEGGWNSRAASARGSSSMGRGGGWGGRSGGGRR